MANLRTYLDQFRSVLIYYVGGVYRYTFEKDIFLWAQAIAFKVLITIVPVVILITGVLSQVLSNLLENQDAFGTVAQFIDDFMPAFGGTEQLLALIQRLQQAGTFFTGLGVFALLFAAMSLFTTLRVVIGNVFQEEWHRHRSVMRGYAFDLRMAAQVGLLFLLTIGFTIFSTAMREGGLEVAERLHLDFVWLQEGWRQAFRWLSYLIPYLLSTAMFFQLFYFVPQPRPPRRSALIGAVVTGLLFELAKQSFTFYATMVGRFDRYNVPGGEEVIGKLGEAFGLIVAFVFWIYYSGVVLIIGALIAVLHEKKVRLGRLRREKEKMERELQERERDEQALHDRELQDRNVHQQALGPEHAEHSEPAHDHSAWHESDGTKESAPDSVIPHRSDT